MFWRVFCLIFLLSHGATVDNRLQLRTLEKKIDQLLDLAEFVQAEMQNLTIDVNKIQVNLVSTCDKEKMEMSDFKNETFLLFEAADAEMAELKNDTVVLCESKEILSGQSFELTMENVLALIQLNPWIFLCIAMSFFALLLWALTVTCILGRVLCKKKQSVDLLSQKSAKDIEVFV
jgi:hypothetical protein